MIVVGILAIVVGVFVIGVGIGVMSAKGGGGYSQSSPEDKIIHEMRTQRAMDYFNNPVVNEMKRESITKRYD